MGRAVAYLQGVVVGVGTSPVAGTGLGVRASFENGRTTTRGKKYVLFEHLSSSTSFGSSRQSIHRADRDGTPCGANDSVDVVKASVETYHGPISFHARC